jgi:uncharacterized membrane protein YsdA (DUF1294 family)
MVTERSVLLILLVLVNIVAGTLMALDKRYSLKQGAERIPEGVLFFMAAIGGGIGIYISMLGFRHKTRKWYFIIGIPVLIVENYFSLLILHLV